MNHALVHRPSPRITDCALTFINREAVDFAGALEQHLEYARALESLGLKVDVLEVNSQCPDSVFVEDVAIILDELAIITPMGNASRRPEIPAMAKEIAKYRELVEISLPATLEGGDVLKVGRTLYVGATSRTNKQGIESLASIVRPFGYTVIPVLVPGCLHLKTCITALDDETFVINPAWLDFSAFGNSRFIEVDPSEPWAGNTLTINGTTLINAAYPITAAKIENMGYKSKRVDISEFVKAEAGLTCMSLIFTELWKSRAEPLVAKNFHTRR